MSKNQTSFKGCGKWDLCGIPQLKKGLITYAPDDGQAIKLKVKDDKINVSLRVLGENISAPRKRSDWEWIEFCLDLPDIVSLADGAELVSPDLRQAFLSGKLTPVLDLKVKVQEGEQKNNKNFVTVDWGLKKLVTICCL